MILIEYIIHTFYSYEFVLLNEEDFEKYGNRNSQVFAIKNDVIIFISILQNEFVHLKI